LGLVVIWLVTPDLDIPRQPFPPDPVRQNRPHRRPCSTVERRFL